MPKSKNITFTDWINSLGVDKVADLLGVQSSTVRHWRRGFCYPRVDQMRDIRKASKGVITYEKIIDGTPTNRSGRVG